MFTFRFIEKYGTHIIVGVKMGGKEVIYVKQQHSSLLQNDDVKRSLKEEADKLFTDSAGRNVTNTNQIYVRENV